MKHNSPLVALPFWLVVASTAIGLVSAVPKLPTPEKVNTCIKDVSGEDCYNLTATGNIWDPWVGHVCVEMPKSESLKVTFDSASWWKFWDAMFWVGNTAAEIPMLPNGTADLAKFPGRKTNLKGKDTVEFDITLDSANACSSGETGYSLVMVSYALIGEPCPNKNGSALFGTEYPAWAQDIDNVKSASKEFTYIEVPIDCHCTPPDEKTTNPGGTGDPHITMWTGHKYDFQGGCDLVLLNYPEFNGGQGLTIHIRTKVQRWWSYIESAVVRIGDTDTLEVMAGNEDKLFWVNGQRRKLEKEGIQSWTIGGFRVRYRTRKRHQHQFKIMIDGEQAILLRVVKDFLRVEIMHPTKEVFGGAWQGLMGTYEHGVMLGRDGLTAFSEPDHFGVEWQVRPEEPHLFHSTQGIQYPELCAMPTVAQTNQRRLEGSISHDSAEAACAYVPAEDRRDCVSDVMATNDVETADLYD